jgi:hypothetical protein
MGQERQIGANLPLVSSTSKIGHRDHHVGGQQWAKSVISRAQSMTSSARASSLPGIVRPARWRWVRLITRLKFPVGASEQRPRVHPHEIRMTVAVFAIFVAIRMQ